jgi:hypothetical protein
MIPLRETGPQFTICVASESAIPISSHVLTVANLTLLAATALNGARLCMEITSISRRESRETKHRPTLPCPPITAILFCIAMLLLRRNEVNFRCHAMSGREGRPHIVIGSHCRRSGERSIGGAAEGTGRHGAPPASDREMAIQPVEMPMNAPAMMSLRK